MVTEIQKPEILTRGKVVSTQHVDQLVGNYKFLRWGQNSDQLGKPDSLSTWYGLTELQDFINLSRENKADGIKMYFGLYPDDYEIQDFRGMQTVVLVATKQTLTGKGLVTKDLFIQRDGRSEILAFNVGQLCPPWCTPPDEGFFENALKDAMSSSS